MASEDERHLCELATALEISGFATQLRHSRPGPTLRVVNPEASMLSENVTVADGYYLWSWGGQIAAVIDVTGAAEALRRVLEAQGAGL